MELDSKRDSTTLKIRNMILQANSNNGSIHLLWIRGHCGTSDNEKADKLTKGALISPQPIHQKISVNNFLPPIIKRLFNKWEQEWDSRTITKGIWYKNIQHIFRDNHGSRSFLCKQKTLNFIIRMRTGHCASPQYFFRIKVKETPSTNVDN